MKGVNKKIWVFLLLFVLVLISCKPEGLSEDSASLILPADDLLNGFKFDGPLDEAALTPPVAASFSRQLFEGRLELLGENDSTNMQMLRGELGEEFSYLPEFEFAFVQNNGFLIPTQRGIIIAEHPVWNIILEPGRVWQEPGDGEYSRTAFPFTLVPKGSNATFNGTMTFLFDDASVSKVWYQVTQETTTHVRANLWGLLDAVYHPETVEDAAQIRADYETELDARMHVKPIEALRLDYPNVDASAFGSGVTPEHMTWYGVVVNGVNYVGGCQTRFGTYPFCEAMRTSSYSTAKSAFASLAVMRLAQKFDVDVSKLLIKDYVPEYTNSAGEWEDVTFNNMIDMASGNYFSSGFMVDDEGEKMGAFFGAQPYENRIKEAFSAPHKVSPGTRWVYRTSDTFILTRAMQNYLQSQEGVSADIYDFVVDEIYKPLGLGTGVFTSMRTEDDNWQGQAEGGYGQWWVPDDIAKIGDFLLNAKGQIDGEQVLNPELLAAGFQQDPTDQGVRIDSRRMYNNSFWSQQFSKADGFDCEFWVPQMLGVSGNVVALFPNGIVYYYFSDNDEFVFDRALRESDKITPICP